MTHRIAEHSGRPARLSLLVPPALLAACLLTAGCAQRTYAPAPPPPPPYGNALIAEADHRGYRAGFEDGQRDLVNGFGYHPRRDRRYAETPGYEPQLGPFPPYQNTFRVAYLRGYSDGFRGR